MTEGNAASTKGYLPSLSTTVARRALRAALLCSFLAGAVSGCFTNNLGDQGNGSPTGGTNSSGSGGSNPFYNGGGSGSGSTGGTTVDLAARLDRVVYSSADPVGSFDLIGVAGSGTFGERCSTPSGSSSSATDTPCRCRYTWDANNITESIEVVTTYVENNLVRCPRTFINPDAASVKVELHYAAVGEYTNAIEFTLNPVLKGLDLTLPSSFVSVRRYQCRDYVFVPYLFSTSADGMYDPFQSDASQLSYPLNFYAGNPGGALMARFIASIGNTQQSLWECSLNASAPASWENLAIFSSVDAPFTQDLCYDSATNTGTSAASGACPVGTSLIISSSRLFMGRNTPSQPAAERGGPENSWDRTNFVLAREASGLFSVPVNAALGPDIFTTTPPSDGSALPDGQFPSLGFAVRPVAGNAGEQCPDSFASNSNSPLNIKIPSGYHWAKLWAWRASIASRKYIKTTVEVQRTGGIMCDPGNWPTGLPPGNDPIGVFEDCSKNWPPSSGTDAGSQFPLTDGNSLAARILGKSKMCVRPTRCLTPGDGCDPEIPRPGFAGQGGVTFPTAPAGSDLFSRVGAHAAFQISSDDFVWVNVPNPGDIDIPSDSELTESNLDSDKPDAGGGVSRFDYLYTVSPTFVMKSDFESTTPSEVGRHFQPQRYQSVDDCRNVDGNGNKPSDLDNIRDTDDLDGDGHPDCRYGRILQYKIYTPEILSGAPTDDFYPLCVLQKDN